jgi:hypothetical protein
MKNILLFLSLLIFSFLTFSNSHSQIPKGIYDIAGLWEMKSEKGTVYERWEITHSGTLTGDDFMIGVNNDTTYIEHMDILMIGDDVYYVASVHNQNNGEPVFFKIFEWTRNVFAFENKEHDFPQVIRYYIKTLDLYTVILEGPEEGNKIKSVELKFERAKK